MRLFALVMCLFVSDPLDSQAADWHSFESVQASISSNSLPGPVYDPKLSIREFNRRIVERDPQQSLLVEITVPRSELSLHKIVDRPVRFESQGEVFGGRVSAVFLSSSKQPSNDEAQREVVTVHALIQNRQTGGQWLLSDGAPGRLFIRR